jgi:hypothetical protein
MVAHVCHPSHGGKLKTEGSWSRLFSAKSSTLPQKQSEHKGLGVVEAAKCLLHERDVLSSYPSTIKRKQKGVQIKTGMVMWSEVLGRQRQEYLTFEARCSSRILSQTQNKRERERERRIAKDSPQVIWHYSSQAHLTE